MRQLSAAEEREIDEAMQLASSFARLTTRHDHTGLLTPRSTCSGSSKESLDSPGPGASGGHVFRFGGLRRRVTGKEEKRTFVDGFSLTCNATDIFTPDAQVRLSHTVDQNRIELEIYKAQCHANISIALTRLYLSHVYQAHKVHAIICQSLTFGSAAQPFIWFSCLSYLCTKDVELLTSSHSAVSNS